MAAAKVHHEVSSWLNTALAGGRYQVTAKLGEGGMGFVLKALDRNLNQPVVIKVPRPAMLEDPTFAGRFAHEVRSLVQLAHPHVVKVLDVGSHQGVPFAVMQFLPGGSLRDRQPRAPDGGRLPLSPADLKAWLPAVAEALDFIHGQRYVHRDVKPDNILFDAHGHAYLGDFGVAKVLADGPAAVPTHTALTGAGTVLGTPQYMAPELLLGQAFDGKIDQYALAVTVYELVAGRYPFDGPTPTAIFVAQTSQEAPPLTAVVPGVPPGLAAAVQRGLAKDPAQRFPNCVGFARAVFASLTFSTRPSKVVVPAAGQAGKRQITCPGCNRAVAVPATAPGQTLRCPLCSQTFRVPDEATAAAPAAAAWWQDQVHDTGKTEQARVDTGVTPAPAAGVPRKRSQLKRKTGLEQPKVVAVTPKRSRVGVVGAFAASVVVLGGIVAGALWLGSRPGTPREPAPSPPPDAVAIGPAVPPAPEVKPADVSPPPAPAPVVTSPPAVPPPAPTPEVKPEPKPEPPTPPKPETKPEPPPEPKPEPKSPPSPAPETKVATTPPPEPKTPVKSPFRLDLPPAPKPRLPVPDAAEREAALKVVKDLYKADYARVRTSDRLALAAKLWKQAKETRDDVTARFVLLREARDLGARYGDTLSALKLTDELADEYDTDALADKLQVLETAARPSGSPTLYRAYAEGALAVADEALDADRYDDALKVLKTAESVAREGRGGAMAVRLLARSKEVEAVRAAFEAQRSARAALEANSNDPAANQAVGKFLCFHKGQWEQGLPLLARGPEGGLRALAQKDIDQPTDAGEQLQVGDGWSELADAEASSAKHQLSARAYHWYKSALPRLSGLSQARADKRVKQLLEQNPDLKAPPAPRTPARARGQRLP